MSLLELIQLIVRHRKWIIFLPISAGIIVFFTTGSIPHTFSSETVIYTGIASGYTTDNDFDNKLDFHAANSRFDNVINIIDSRETRKEVCIQLLSYMLHHDSARINMLTAVKNKTLNGILDTEFIKKYKKENETATTESLRTEISNGPGNLIYKLIYGDFKSPFSLTTLSTIKAVRLGFSDMLKISYSNEDPFTCKKTLDLTTDIFLKKYQEVRVGEADAALKYFTDQTADAKTKLQLSEERLKLFRSSNGVINYYEQTKYVADQKDDLEKNETRLKMELEGFRSALVIVESKLDKRTLLQLQNEKILNTRNELAGEFQRIGLESVRADVPSQESSAITGLKQELKKNVENLYELNNTLEGLPSKTLLDQWIQLTLNADETQSKLKILVDYKKEFEKAFVRFAPLGSDLNKLDRDVDVCEKEYLNLLHSLSQAILRKNNLKVSETISVVDTAELPLTANPSKRIILVISSVIGCSVFSIAVLILRSFLDQSMSSPLRLEKTTGITTATAFCSPELGKDVVMELDKRSFDKFYNSLTEINFLLNEKCNAYILNFNCADSTFENLPAKFETYFQGKKNEWSVYNSTTRLNDDREVNKLIFSSVNYSDFISICKEKSTAVFLVFDSSKKLNEYDLQLIEKWKSSKAEIRTILTDVNDQETGKYLGEIPKKRSKFRSFIKRQLLRYAA